MLELAVELSGAFSLRRVRAPGRTDARRRASTMRLRAIAYSHVRTLALLES